MAYLKGIVEGNIDSIKDLTINEDKIYVVKDLPDNSITNAVMQQAIDDINVGALLDLNNTYVCIDDGVYKKDNIYKWTGTAWERVAVSDPIDDVTITRNDNGEIQAVGLRGTNETKSADSIISATTFIVLEDDE